ncbi:hypothetical protein ABBQ38_004703 [Trebouxia sp. C0009 RCD-2024]
MSTSYTCDQTALLKVLLHAAKYPAASVNGVLLGRTASDRPIVEIVDAIPFLHSFLTLAPALETALIQASSYARQKGLQLVGYYHANERFDDTELASSARKVADKLYSHNSSACAVLVNSPKLAKGLRTKSGEFLQLYLKDEGGRTWVKGSSLKYDSGSVLSVLPEMCSQGRHQRLSDFDDHLNDISRDWRNEELLI